VKRIWFLLLLIILSACSAGNNGKSGFLSQDPHPETRESAIRRFVDYRLGSGDVLDIIYQIQQPETDLYRLKIQDRIEIRFPSMPDQNQEQEIRTDGMISLPFVDDIVIAGLTIDQATRKLQATYKAVLRFPDVYIVLKESDARIQELKMVIGTATRGQSRLLKVRPDGYVTFPIIGELLVAGQTIPRVSSTVNELYSRRHPELRVDVILEQMADRFFYVIGEVKKAGAYKIERPLTVQESLALAGGPTSTSRMQDVILARRKGDIVRYNRVDLKHLGRDTKAIAVQADDIIFVPRRKLATAAEIANELSQILFFRGVSVGFNYRLDEENN
jgi:polysaccharide export outer membrane protein